MADVLTKEQRKKNMQHIKAKDTKIEVLLRKALSHEAAKWLNIQQLEDVDWLPADVTLIEKIKKDMFKATK